MKIEINQNVVVEPTGWLLLIHPDFLWNTTLARKIKSFDFFQYAVNEALFLSDKEEKTIDILLKIEQEYQSNIDKFSQELIVAQIELLLIYSERFYERQFLTPKKSNFELLERFEKVILKYFENGKLSENGIPTVTSMAEQLNISPNYLGSTTHTHSTKHSTAYSKQTY